MKELPVTQENERGKNWSYLFEAHNLRTIRDIFVYLALKGRMRETQLYEDMEEFKIPPPKGHWVRSNRKRTERYRLGYIHAAEYLELIKRENGFVEPNLDTYWKEKETLVRENKKRTFEPSGYSPCLSEKEKKALNKIILEYDRARDFLRWFLDFSKFPDSYSFEVKDFLEHAEPIFVLGRTAKGKKGSDILRREIDGKLWKIPDSYIRLVWVFRNWFSEGGLIDRVIVFPEFSEDKKLWHMIYPIKMNTEGFLAMDIRDHIERTFLKNKTKETVWIPYLIYKLARTFYCSVDAIKLSVKRTYKEDFTHFYLERTSLQVMKKHSQYKSSYLKIDGFYRSTLKLTKREEENGGKVSR